MPLPRPHHALLGLLLAALSACVLEPSEVLSDHSSRLSDLVVREVITRHPTLHDSLIERSYELTRGAEARALGGYTDEATEGLTRPPFVSGHALVLLSTWHVAVVEDVDGALASSRVTWISPYDAPCFAEHSALHGYYELRATDAEIGDRVWTLSFEPHPFRAPSGMPEEVVLRSRDRGRTWTWDACPAR